MEAINFKSKYLIINQDEKGNRKDNCYSSDGNCRKCRYAKECGWFLNINNLNKDD